MMGLQHVGYVEVERDKWLPVYDSPPPKDRPSINTPEGWNALCDRMGWRRAH